MANGRSVNVSVWVAVPVACSLVGSLVLVGSMLWRDATWRASVATRADVDLVRQAVNDLARRLDCFDLTDEQCEVERRSRRERRNGP